MAAPRRAWLVFGFSTEEAAGEPGPGPGPRRLESGPEGIRRVWPAWSYVVVETGAGLEVRSAGLRRRLPPGWTEALPSETHLVLRGPAAARAWPRAAALRGALRGAAAWSRALPPPGPRRPPPLPLLPGGFATPRPPFFGALPGGVRARRLALGQEHVVALGAAGEVYAWGGGSDVGMFYCVSGWLGLWLRLLVHQLSTNLSFLWVSDGQVPCLCSALSFTRLLQISVRKVQLPLLLLLCNMSQRQPPAVKDQFVSKMDSGTTRLLALQYKIPLLGRGVNPLGKASTPDALFHLPAVALGCNK
ncbi:RCC1 domain-containing protein 1 isoform X9 [Aquila chrysaetos chrysaetos]|uniref:RCC1 domain-containing protein 1 isoform X9 n=1 Tax=Aquila chrysaetos chrysaetos TaxID=223781 RepID=UPI0011771DAD|nr:RCC1 domain-containing protein 1 isoform X9 [Aquila chrysaetos chrysaetos]